MRFLVLAIVLLIADDALGAECMSVGNYVSCSDGQWGQRIGPNIYFPVSPQSQQPGDVWGGAVVKPQSDEDRRAIDAIINRPLPQLR